MRISEARTNVYRIPVGREMSDAIQRISVIEYVFVRLKTDDGLEGVGWTFTHGAGGIALKALLDNDMLPMVKGEDPRNIERLWHKMWWGLHAIGSSGFTSLAIAAVDIALWDIIAKERRLPLYKALGAHRETVPIYGSGVNLYFPMDELLAQVRGFLKEGVCGIKMKVGRPNLTEDLERLTAVREVVGPAMPLMVDGNQGWTVAGAINRARAMEPFNLTWLEEPILADDHVGYEVLARSVNVPLAAGETRYSRFEFADLIERKALGFVQPDVCRCGGISEWLRIAKLAEGYNLPVAPHGPEELHTHLCCAVSNGYIIEHGDRRGVLGNLEEHLVSNDGYFTPFQQPGHGIRWRSDVLEKHKVA
jgi:L-alanine-DL-glutamate epimerase-like enolase superfamily enzyme